MHSKKTVDERLVGHPTWQTRDNLRNYTACLSRVSATLNTFACLPNILEESGVEGVFVSHRNVQ